MIIYVEGLACAGKTTLMKYLKKYSYLNNNIKIIPELPSLYYKKKDRLDGICRNNDEKKCKAAEELSKKGFIVLVDRSYISTLAYNYIQFRIHKSSEYPRSLRWYFNGINSSILVKPKAYIYVSVPIREIKKRFELLNKLNENKYNLSKAWFISPRLGEKFYKSFFDLIEPDIPVIQINGLENLHTQMEFCEHALNKLKGDQNAQTK